MFDELDLPPASVKEKYRHNIAAIRTLKEIEASGLAATPQQQKTLAGYSGWGGIPQVFDESNTKWSSEYAEVKALLTNQEYESARASTPNAHYTSPEVIKTIYTALASFGFEGGRVLEPSMGVGGFFALYPQEWRESTELHGVELDSVSGRIGQLLYPSAHITIDGFENVPLEADEFDVAVGNVPFGTYQLYDPEFNKHNLLIHDYFFAKALSKVRPGGILAFITSKGTLDKENAKFRQYLAQRARLIGAIRLPNTAFKGTANTEVTTDIIFLQKREEPCFEPQPWTELSHTEDGVPINRYFAEHPEMILGTMAFCRNMYGNERDTACIPFPDSDFSFLLQQVAQELSATISPRPEVPERPISIPADPNVKNYSYTVFDGNVYYREGSRMLLQEQLIETQKLRLEGMCEIRQQLHHVLNIQLANCSDGELAEAQETLNGLYDAFIREYGYLNNRINSRLFSEDCDSALLLSLEYSEMEQQEDESPQITYEKADVFFKRTIQGVREVDRADSALDALALSINKLGRVDFPYMTSLYPASVEQLVEELGEEIYLNPARYDPEDRTKGWEPADEYLSGDVRAKMEIAKAQNDNHLFDRNLEALEQALPPWLEAADIDIRLGSAWVDIEYYNQFMYEAFEVPFWKRGEESGRVYITYNTHKHEYVIYNKGLDDSAVVTEKYGTGRMNAYAILEASLNLRNVVVKDVVPHVTPSGKDSVKYVVNHAETVMASQKQEKLKQAFRDWILKDGERRNTLVTKYNRLFNNIRHRQYDGSRLALPGISPLVQLRPHQLDAVMRIRSGNNTLLAHCVGAGKTYTMIAGAMEQIRLGLANKVALVVPNHITRQFGKAIFILYPQAKALITTKEDFEKKNRQKFLSRVALSDMELVVIGHSQFEKIMMPIAYQEQKLRKELEEIMFGLDQARKERGLHWTVKQMESQKKSLESQLKKLLESSRKDTMITFDQMGINSLFVDEAHYYKNLATFSKMTNVAGVSNAKAQKASDMCMKCDYLSEFNGIVTFATGTPISNSIAEMYVMQRYLQQDLLLSKGIRCFDEWASIFGETTTERELTPEGNGYRFRTRFAKFHNVPVLMQMFCEVADIQTADMLQLPVPKLAGGKAQVVVSSPSEELKEFMKQGIERVQNIRNGAVDPSVDNMLKFIGDARRAGLDMRLIDPTASFDPNGKIAKCAINIHKHYIESMETKGTQLVFCDTSVPGPGKSFDAYTALKACCVHLGVPEETIAFMTDVNTDRQKEELFAKVREGQVRVLVGSTVRCGAGTNIQDRMIALHHLDCPYRPTDIEQREGRILRQGNLFDEVYVYRYVTEKSFDAYLWNIVEKKQRFISQVMTGRAIGRDCEDIDEATISYAEAQAIASGNPLVKEKIEVDGEVNRLSLLRNQHINQQYRLMDRLEKDYPQQLQHHEANMVSIQQDIQLRDANRTLEFFIKIQRKLYDSREDAAILISALGRQLGDQEMIIGSMMGFSISLVKVKFDSGLLACLNGSRRYSTEWWPELGHSNLIRLENQIKGLETLLEKESRKHGEVQKSISATRKMIQEPFEQEKELARLQERQQELDKLLDVADNEQKPVGKEEPQYTQDQAMMH